MKTKIAPKKTKGRPAAKRPPRPGRRAVRDENARERILRGARKVFSLHAFRAATTRMIAQEAGVDHPLIHYHYGSKELLFEAVADQMYEEFAQAHLACLEDIRYLPLDQGFSLYLDRLLDYCLENPEPLQLIALNMVHVGRLEEIPGYRFILLHMERIRQTLQEKITMRGPKAEVGRFIHCFHVLVISFIGAKTCQAQFLGVDPESKKYRAWMKQSFMILFLPTLEKLIFPPKEAAASPSEKSFKKKSKKQTRKTKKSRF